MDNRFKEQEKEYHSKIEDLRLFYQTEINQLKQENSFLKEKIGKVREVFDFTNQQNNNNNTNNNKNYQSSKP